MPQPPETITPTITPDAVLERFEMLCDQYRMGVLDAAAFNQLLNVFQFPDADGVLWAPGARSGKWFRWDGRQWQPGTPPGELTLPQMPLGIVPEPRRQPQPLPRTQPAAPASPPAAPAPAASVGAGFCGQCGAPRPGKKFCMTCGAKLD